jgi:hypothetical protein
MAFNPVYDFKESSDSGRPERLVPCTKCKQKITLLSPATSFCWACYAGWPTVTKPVYDLHKHPHYLKTMARLAVLAEAKAARKAARLAEQMAA